METVARAGGNASGLTSFSVELSAKRLQFLKDILPSLARVALLINPTASISALYVRQSNEAAPKLGLSTHAFAARSLRQLEPAFDAMVNAGKPSSSTPRACPIEERTGSRRSRPLDVCRPAPGCGSLWRRARSSPMASTSARSPAVWPCTSTDTEGREAGWHPRGATDDLRDGRQCQGREGARADDPVVDTDSGQSSH